jgi:hypothetical protein
LKAAAVAGATVGAGLLLAACNKTNVASIATTPEEKPKDSTGDTGDQGDDNTDTTEPGPDTTTPEQGSTAEDFVPPLDKSVSWPYGSVEFGASPPGLDYRYGLNNGTLYYLDLDEKMWYKVPDDAWSKNTQETLYYLIGGPNDPDQTNN